MTDRIIRWISAGVMTAGLSSAVILGAGTAYATPGTDSGAGSADTAEPADTAEDSAPSDEADPGYGDAAGTPSSSSDEVDDEAATEDEESATEAEADLVAAAEEDDPTSAAEEDDSLEQTVEEADLDEGTAVDPIATEEPEVAPESVADAATTTETDDEHNGAPHEGQEADSAPSVAAGPDAPTTPPGDNELAVSAEDTVADGSPSPVDPASVAESADPVDEVALQMTAAESAATANARPRLINVVGTIAWGVLDFMTNMLAGPATVPSNSTVRVGRSTLEIDCGDGYTAVADWYVPTGPEPPTGMILLQHGMAAHGGFYNAIAAKLAEQTNSIVLAPTITSNMFACDSCQLVGDPMHFAIAKLFSGERAALNASLDAAFRGEDIALPQRYVLAGHSGGSQTAIGVAGFASQLAGPGGSPDLAGVIMYDTNDIGDFLARAIPKIPETTPLYYLGGDPSMLNAFRDVNGLMTQLRPDQFNGLFLAGGTHWDIIAETTNVLVKFLSTLLMGSPETQNVAAAEMITVGWINDMFSGGPDTGIYTAPGESIEIPTIAGTAHAAALGGPVYEPNFFQSLIKLAYGFATYLRFGYCAADVEALLKDEVGGTCSA